tara:strand:- start:1185 stop:1409 length:225 start_codon:yes stop_codon:yes gene_type:complete
MRGKTKGATSFVMVSLEDLNAILRPNANVQVGRKFAEALGLTGESMPSNPKTIREVTDTTPPVEVETVDFDMEN